MLDEAGNVLLERSLPTTSNGVRQAFGRIPRCRIALETGTHSPWVSRQLSQMGHEVIVARARNVRLIGESSRKDDQLDARTLARLVRIDPELLSPVRHRSAQAQIHLTVIRARAALVSTRTALVNAARGLTNSYGERLKKCGTEQMNRDSSQGLSQELRDGFAGGILPTNAQKSAEECRRHDVPHVLCWRQLSSKNRLVELGSGTLEIDILTGKSIFDEKGIPKLPIAIELQLSLQRFLVSNRIHIPVLRARLRVKLSFSRIT
jgi:hypothetical protein